MLMEKSGEEKRTRKVRNKAETPYSKKQGGMRWVKEGSKKTNRVPGETNITGALKGNQFSRSSKQHFCRITHALKSSRQFQDDCCKRKAAACNLRQIHKLRKGGGEPEEIRAAVKESFSKITFEITIDSRSEI